MLCLILDTKNPTDHYGYISHDKMVLRCRPEVQLCLSVGQTDPGVESVEHQTKMERWGKVQKIKGNNERLPFLVNQTRESVFIFGYHLYFCYFPSPIH